MLIDTCLIPFESKKHCFKTLNNNFQNCLYFHFRKFFQEFLVISSDSSQIVVEDKNRWRNKNVGFRCSPEEGIEIDKRWKMCGFCTKQDYILECLLHPYLIARGNPMMLISIRKELKEISVELSRIDDASEIDEELFTPIRTMLLF